MKKELMSYLKSMQSLESDMYTYECSKSEILNDITRAAYEKERIREPYLSLPREPEKSRVTDLQYRIDRIKEYSYFSEGHKSGGFWATLIIIFFAFITVFISIEGQMDEEALIGMVLASVFVTLIFGFLPAKWIGAAMLKSKAIEEEKESYAKEVLQADDKYREAYRQYQNECQRLQREYNNQKEENRRKRQELDDRIASLQRAMDTIDANMSELQAKIDEAYSIDIIYPKYRGLVPISMFIEYFETGRCDSLTGHEGAYNLYEAELRQNLIISSLRNITNKMDDMKQRQFRLYSAVKEANRISGEISKYAIEGAKQNRLAADNAAITALHAKSISESTKLIADIEAEKLSELKKFTEID